MIKESNPIEVKEHSMDNGYSNEIAFRCWVYKALKKHDRLVNKVKSRCQNNRLKFGGEVTLPVEYYLRIDQENGNTLWHDSIEDLFRFSRQG